LEEETFYDFFVMFKEIEILDVPFMIWKKYEGN